MDSAVCEEKGHQVGCQRAQNPSTNWMILKRGILLICSVLLVCIIAVGIRFIVDRQNYIELKETDIWSRVHIGMTPSQVVQAIGTPDRREREFLIFGDSYWLYSHSDAALGRYPITIHFKNGKVATMIQE